MSYDTKQKGIASSTPSGFKRWVLSKAMTYVGSKALEDKTRRKAEAKRQASGDPHIVDYFHEVGDAYSSLAVQVLAKLVDSYDIVIRCHLVRPDTGPNLPEPDMLRALSLTDSLLIAEPYGLAKPGASQIPGDALIRLAEAILVNLDNHSFPTVAPAVEAALWSHDEAGLKALADKVGQADAETVDKRVSKAMAYRAELGHYSGAMFAYGGEWYWGVDRLYHLEMRLISLDATRKPNASLIVPRPAIEQSKVKDNGSITLEYYPSLRSPYTAVSWDQTLEFAKASGISLVVKPVLPMVMRGVSATRQKGVYIFKDTAREARYVGAEYDKFYDPIGDPVKRCYALYPWACTQGKGNALLGAFLKAAFFHGINTNSMKGLRSVVQAAGLDWTEAKTHLLDTEWQELLEQNRKDMYGFGSWGVPSYRLLDQQGTEVLGVWGQDRLWLISQKVNDLL